jgi:apolipoprotein D and lipocalin family protein
VDPDYRWALLGHPDRSMAWIFSRTADMPDAQYETLRARLRRFGIDPTALRRVPQFAEQVGRPGFE